MAQVCERHPGISEGALRRWVFDAAPRTVYVSGKPEVRPGNGLQRAVKRIGRKVLIDERALLAWIDEQTENHNKGR